LGDFSQPHLVTGEVQQTKMDIHPEFSLSVLAIIYFAHYVHRRRFYGEPWHGVVQWTLQPPEKKKTKVRIPTSFKVSREMLLCIHRCMEIEFSEK
jgi:hypothetical protein